MPCYREEISRVEPLDSAVARLSKKSFVLFIQCPPDEGLFLLDCRQIRVAALQPIRVPLDIPWGPNCQTMRNETWLAVKWLRKPLKKLQRPRYIMYFCLSKYFGRNVCLKWTLTTGILLSGIHSRFKLACIAWRFCKLKFLLKPPSYAG